MKGVYWSSDGSLNSCIIETEFWPQKCLININIDRLYVLYCWCVCGVCVGVWILYDTMHCDMSTIHHTLSVTKYHTHTLTHSHTHTLTHTHTHTLTHTLTHSLTHTHPLTHSLTHPHMSSHTHWFPHSLTHTHTLTHLHTHTLTHIYSLVGQQQVVILSLTDMLLLNLPRPPQSEYSQNTVMCSDSESLYLEFGLSNFKTKVCIQ